MASNSFADDTTLSRGTKINSARGSTKFLISHGQAILSIFGLSRVIHFIALDFLQILAYLQKRNRMDLTFSTRFTFLQFFFKCGWVFTHMFFENPGKVAL